MIDPEHRERIRQRNYKDRQFECFFNFLNWWQWSIGIHVDPQHPHLDVHVLFGFFRIGWYSERVSWSRLDAKTQRTIYFARPIYDR